MCVDLKGKKKEVVQIQESSWKLQSYPPLPAYRARIMLHQSLNTQRTQRSSEDGQLDLVAALAVHGQRAVDELLPRLIHALVHLEQLHLAVRVAVTLHVGLEPGPFRDGVADAAEEVGLVIRRCDARAGEDGGEVVLGLERQRGREVVVLVKVGAGAVLLPLVAPELEAAPVLARQRAPALLQRLEQVTDLPGPQRVAVVAVLGPALAAAAQARHGEEGRVAQHGAGQTVSTAPAGGVVGPQPVDAELRRRLARLR
ncbi:hypothetical protein PR202_ga29079 [Eleusine coracana subsp. coracana]|uniref:Uncharacterized protein n=1 Tax=Eleusine coracana subsp. coracana TaxID=191504 RepID=A0AAV5DL31_ELECO|nr:hypothetical protein PR202_ga29079 [Eleusine coracana subsp. coracana]